GSSRGRDPTAEFQLRCGRLILQAEVQTNSHDQAQGVLYESSLTGWHDADTVGAVSLIIRGSAVFGDKACLDR
ncbi:hypothetical protein LTR16_011240, partial [Cryomyces antarcticus]